MTKPETRTGYTAAQAKEITVRERTAEQLAIKIDPTLSHNEVATTLYVATPPPERHIEVRRTTDRINNGEDNKYTVPLTIASVAILSLYAWACYATGGAAFLAIPFIYGAMAGVNKQQMQPGFIGGVFQRFFAGLNIGLVPGMIAAYLFAGAATAPFSLPVLTLVGGISVLSGIAASLGHIVANGLEFIDNTRFGEDARGARARAQARAQRVRN